VARSAGAYPDVTEPDHEALQDAVQIGRAIVETGSGIANPAGDADGAGWWR
jgi:hypothetical protein